MTQGLQAGIHDGSYRCRVGGFTMSDVVTWSTTSYPLYTRLRCVHANLLARLVQNPCYEALPDQFLSIFPGADQSYKRCRSYIETLW